MEQNLLALWDILEDTYLALVIFFSQMPFLLIEVAGVNIAQMLASCLILLICGTPIALFIRGIARILRKW